MYHTKGLCISGIAMVPSFTYPNNDLLFSYIHPYNHSMDFNIYLLVTLLTIAVTPLFTPALPIKSI